MSGMATDGDLAMEAEDESAVNERRLMGLGKPTKAM
ncbi:hypothetical protein T05_5714 [Trichinella murrelli]|uniref:Uncharacterized protein n=1 Tax=Trichinella murrelli TaxID=144512 RepID=A0A0V0TSU5_9BILA|nr:hypothetical protein T05_9405 [Trichinella murrelli]KRX41182.1 hypothetical protein T05_9980 [Trichinella murrelli]KRX42063.1 hypothetical protein T05_5714 [Trichinella murrelli]